MAERKNEETPPVKRPIGRPRKQGIRNTEHITRPDVRPGHPINVLLRLVPELGALKRSEIYRALHGALRRASSVVARRGEAGGMGQRSRVARRALQGDIRRAGRNFGTFRVVLMSTEKDHLHLLVEADDRVALARGMQAFTISAAKKLNAMMRGPDGKRRRGSVFGDRYHATEIANPREARRSLCTCPKPPKAS